MIWKHVSICAPVQDAMLSLEELNINYVVSICAPVQDAILMETPRLDQIRFQSAHPHRMRSSGSAALPVFIPFQSTHPYRMRYWQKRKRQWLNLGFNLRTRTGCDETRTEETRKETVSICAPVQDAIDPFTPAR